MRRVQDLYDPSDITARMPAMAVSHSARPPLPRGRWQPAVDVFAMILLLFGFLATVLFCVCMVVGAFVVIGWMGGL